MAATSDASAVVSKLFLKGWEAWRKIDAYEVTSASPEHSRCVCDGVAALERATEMASQLYLFSHNEQLDELATSNLKYLLLPALLGELSLQSKEGERMDVILKARVYFVDYLRRCKSYGLTQDDPPPLTLPPSDPAPSSASRGGAESQRKTYEQLASERAAKIQRLKEKKELERRTMELTAMLNGGGRWGEGEEEEEEEGRGAWVALLQLHVYRSQEFVKSVEDEVPLLQHMAAVRKGAVPADPASKKLGEASGSSQTETSPRQPVKPLVITREMLRGEIFGAGYPSVPTMTVEEFYQQRYGQEGERGKAPGGEGERMEEEKGKEKEEEKEEEEEEETEASLKKAREWDDFKDENRRGWGNRKNMG